MHSGLSWWCVSLTFCIMFPRNTSIHQRYMIKFACIPLLPYFLYGWLRLFVSLEFHRSRRAATLSSSPDTDMSGRIRLDSFLIVRTTSTGGSEIEKQHKV